MKKMLALLIATGMTVVLFCGCEMLSESFHESNATVVVLNVPVEKIPAAIKDAAPRAGLSIGQTKETAVNGAFKGGDTEITYKKMDDKTTKLFIRCGSVGNRDKETLMFNEIRKSLGLQ